MMCPTAGGDLLDFAIANASRSCDVAAGLRRRRRLRASVGDHRRARQWIRTAQFSDRVPLR